MFQHFQLPLCRHNFSWKNILLVGSSPKQISSHNFCDAWQEEEKSGQKLAFPLSHPQVDDGARQNLPEFIITVWFQDSFISVRDFLCRRGTYGPNSFTCSEENGKADKSKLLQVKAFHKLRLLYSTTSQNSSQFSFLCDVLVCLVATCEHGDIYVK